MHGPQFPSASQVRLPVPTHSAPVKQGPVAPGAHPVTGGTPPVDSEQSLSSSS